MKIHQLKTESGHYQQVKFLKKKFEIRYNDRNYRIGDILHLKEIRTVDHKDPTPSYTGMELLARVEYILNDFEGLAEGYVAMAITVLT